MSYSEAVNKLLQIVTTCYNRTRRLENIAEYGIWLQKNGDTNKLKEFIHLILSKN